MSGTPSSRIWSIVEHARNVHRIRIALDRKGDEFWALLQSDVHWDNPKCDRTLLVRHWDQARERDAPILDNGDFFCAMQGKWDRRSSKDDLRPEHRTAQYLDSLIDTAVEFVAPYQDLLTVRGQGNHETAILKRHETHLTERFVERLRSSGSANVHLGGYSGFVVFEVSVHGRRQPIKMHYHHGHGGGGPITRGVIQASRQAMYLADADLVWTGHTHDGWKFPISRVRLNSDASSVVHERQEHFRTPGYKQAWGDGYGGWEIEKGLPPKLLGAAWLRVTNQGTRRIDQQRFDLIDWDVLEAK